MMRAASLLVLAALVGACAGPDAGLASDGEGPSTTTTIGTFPAIVSEDEPGPRLLVEGRVVDAVDGTPIAGATVAVYQTDQSGTYQPADPADESTARLHGEFTTDSDGRFGFHTVQPGEYPDQPPGNRHIHFHSVTATGYSGTGFVLLFDDNARPEVRSWAEETGFGVVIPLDGDPETGLRGEVVIPLDPAAG
jgi:protocatechuate 3,4-dioxygenase beta subunit